MNALGAAANKPHEELILVDAADRELGFLSKERCHRGSGRLHRAFSVFLFNSRGELLLQQRSAAKPLWPLHWANSCCSHPRRGESVESAVQRRLAEELALSAEVRFLYKFEYQASYGQVGSEHELCWVFAGFTDEEPRVDANEVAAWRHIAPAALSAEIADNPDIFTPWLKLEWAEIRAHHLPALAGLRPGGG
ncbi:MAG: isopentenyl-diphosphate Delta-isomerase [Gammaproteobacteria bacterium]|nr:isopentenyl-diphosphate Delta-isomerase [Gammaproteobacteria bacterium]